MTKERVFLTILSISGAVAVGLGAFGAHGLEGRLSAGALETYQTAVRYQFYQTLALLVVVVTLTRWPTSKMATTAGWLFVAGIVLFSGSLYVLVMTGVTWLGAITPLGGVAFIVGWLLLATVAWRGR
ncbi:MAG: DUF423 domain-containing protein [Caldilineaceae bacterium]|jgi:uncharacterized membrane protein YgdD (TMEM256/DUF423 family)